MSPTQFEVTYRHNQTHELTHSRVTVLASTITAGIRKAVTEAAASRPAGTSLVAVTWVSLVG